MAWLEIGPEGTWAINARTFRGGRHWVTDAGILTEAKNQTGVEIDYESPEPLEGEPGYVAPNPAEQSSGPLTTADLGRTSEDGIKPVEKVERDTPAQPTDEIEVKVPKSSDAIIGSVTVDPDKAPKKGKGKAKEE